MNSPGQAVPLEDAATAILPAVSVVISTRNRGGNIWATMQALLGQEVAPCEIIVVDQSDSGLAESTRQAVCQAAAEAGWLAYCVDGEKPAEEFPDRQNSQTAAAPGRVLYIASRRRGLSAGRNTGAGRAGGEIVLFTDDDVIPDRRWIAATAEEFAAGSNTAIVGGRIVPLQKGAAGAAPSAARRTGAELTRGGLERREYDEPVLPWWLASGGNMAVRRTVFESSGGFDEILGAGAPLRSCEDLDICYRILAHRHGKVVFTPASLVYHDNLKDWAEVVRTERSYGVGAGAVFLKFWRCGHRPAARLFATWIWHMAVRRTGAGLLKWRNLQVVRLALQQFYAPFEGLLAATRFPVDRKRWLFRPAGARPDAS